MGRMVLMTCSRCRCKRHSSRIDTKYAAMSERDMKEITSKTCLKDKLLSIGA